MSNLEKMFGVWLSVGFYLFLSFQAFAQCEAPGEAAAAATDVQMQQENALDQLEESLGLAFQAEIENLKAALSPLNKVDWFWTQWGSALKDMTAQLSSATLDQSRQMSRVNDAGNEMKASLEMQKQDAESKKAYQTTGEACIFDTAALYSANSRKISDAYTTGLSLDFLRMGNNAADGPSSAGSRGMVGGGWNAYTKRFCDSTAFGGHAGCTTELVNRNMNLLIGRLLFSKDTLDLEDQDKRFALQMMLLNITGYIPPDPMEAHALKTLTGKARLVGNREYLAQMDAVGALAYGVAADRAPGAPAPQVKALREKSGIMNASERPSLNELRQAAVEQLWSPDYYKNLYDNPGTIAQKELYLRAHNLALLYDIIARQEKISNAYAIEAANIINGANEQRGSATNVAPVGGR